MLIYFFFLILIIIIDLLKVQSKLILASTIVLVGLFLCFGYMTGSDWRYYELDYNELNIKNYSNIDYELGYFFYMLPFKYLGIGFWPFFIFTKVILYSINIHFLRKYLAENFYIAFAIFFCLFAVFEFIDNPMRNLIASTIFLFAYQFILEKKFAKYLLISIFAILFHKALFLMIPLYFILNRNYKTKNIVVLFVVFNILLFVFNEQLILIFKTIDFLSFSDSQKYGQQISGYILSDKIRDNPFSLGLISRYFIFIILVLFKNKIESYSKYGNIAFNSSIVTLYILRLALVWPIIGRFAIPFSIFYCVTLATVISCSKGTSKLRYYFIFILIYSGVLYTQITTVYKYIPYSNYLFYIGYDKPSYQFRSDYNFIHGPYKN